MLNIIKGYRTGQKHIVRAVTPAARLELFRALAASYTSKDWREARAAMHAPESSPLSAGFNTRDCGVRTDRTPVMVGFCDPQFRREQWADKAEGVRMDHRGWYADADCSETLRAFVFNLPHGRFGCGYANSGTGERVYLLEVHSDVSDAASSADNEAERIAEDMKEYSERWADAHELQDDIKQKEKEVREGYALRNMAQFEYIREEVRSDIEKLRNLRKRMADEFADVEF